MIIMLMHAPAIKSKALTAIAIVNAAFAPSTGVAFSYEMPSDHFAYNVTDSETI